jgi:uncharacterized protein (TIGR02328 family)
LLTSYHFSAAGRGHVCTIAVRAAQITKIKKERKNTMRLWSKQLIKYLPREQLVAQWRELSAIAGAIQKNGTPNHILVNKVLDYDFDHFITYASLVREEMTKRGHRTMNCVWEKITSLKPDWKPIDFNHLFWFWHDDRYLKQCFYNLEEKFDCGGVDAKVYKAMVQEFNKRLNLGYNPSEWYY